MSKWSRLSPQEKELAEFRRDDILATFIQEETQYIAALNSVVEVCAHDPRVSECHCAKLPC
jgi:hypothetical protein